MLFRSSVANQARYVLARDLLADPSHTHAPDERDRLQADMRRCLESEIALARELYALVQEDARIGFEPSCQYFYLPLDLVEKVINCRWLLEHQAAAPSPLQQTPAVDASGHPAAAPPQS